MIRLDILLREAHMGEIYAALDELSADRRDAIRAYLVALEKDRLIKEAQE
jgi:hypothetical protein